MLIHLDTEAPADADAEYWLKAMRKRRNKLLTACDWTQTNDAPVDQHAWMAYRQALRDFPSTWTPSETVEFPEPPS